MRNEEEFEKLQKKNERLRERLDNLIGLNHPLYSPIWALINELVENELQQEELCEQ